MRRLLTTAALLGILSLSSLPASAGSSRHRHSGIRVHVGLPHVSVVLGQPHSYHRPYVYGYGSYSPYGYSSYYPYSYGYGSNYGYYSDGYRSRHRSYRQHDRYDVGRRYDRYDHNRHDSGRGRHRHSRSCSHR